MSSHLEVSPPFPIEGRQAESLSYTGVRQALSLSPLGNRGIELPQKNQSECRIRISSHLEISPPFPIGHRGIELSLFRPEEMQVVRNHVVAERRPCKRTRLQCSDRFIQ